jgi:uncharacterized protein with HEPN domain
MRRDFRLYLDDIIEAINKIHDYTVGMDYASFSNDAKTQDAVVRNLEIIGEAAGRLQGQVKDMSPDIEWRKIVALRNILIHEYFGVSLPIVWDIIQSKLDSLESTCQALLNNLPNT